MSKLTELEELQQGISKDREEGDFYYAAWRTYISKIQDAAPDLLRLARAVENARDTLIESAVMQALEKDRDAAMKLHAIIAALGTLTGAEDKTAS